MSAVEKAKRDLERLNTYIENVNNGIGDPSYLEKAHQAKEEILEKFPSLIQQYVQVKPSRKRNFESTEDEIPLPPAQYYQRPHVQPQTQQYCPPAEPIYFQPAAQTHPQYYQPAGPTYSNYQPAAQTHPQYYPPACPAYSNYQPTAPAHPQLIQPAMSRQESIIGRPADTKFLNCVRIIVQKTSTIVEYIVNNFGLPEADIKSLRDYSNFNRGILGNADDDEIFADAAKFLKDILNRVKNNCDKNIVTDYTKTKYINATNGIIFYSFNYKLNENNFSEINNLYIGFVESKITSLRDGAAKNYLNYIVKTLEKMPEDS